MGFIVASKTEYKGIRFDSMLELKFYKHLEAKELKVETQVPFLYKGTSRVYRLDFVIHHPSGRIYYVDIKSGVTFTNLCRFKASLIENMYGIRIDYVFKADFLTYTAFMDSGEGCSFARWKQINR